MDHQNEYIISGGSSGKSRLNTLSDVLHDHTKSLLEAQGVKTGKSLLDVGCGGGNVSLMAAQMVGGSGSITAIDFDAGIIALAQQDAGVADIKNITYRVTGAHEMKFDGEFDFAYARFLLSHIHEPLEVLYKMKQSVKHGGRIIVEDVQFSGHFCYPACAAFEQYVQFYTQAADQRGANANIGPALFLLFQRAGIKDVGFDMIQPCANTGPAKLMALVTLDRIKDSLIKSGIADPQTIDRMKDELQQFTDDEQTIMSLPRIFRVWGTKQ
jgi:ubiquinone/menaquinone biosynthesis C-methylase UbiE